MKPLSPRRMAILEFIVECVDERGYPPTIREIGERVGLTSSSSVHHQLRALERAGYLVRDPGRSRAMVLQLPGSAA